MEQRDDVFLNGPEIDQHIAATDQVQFRERRIANEVMPAEYTQLAQTLVDLVAALDLCKIAPQAFRADFRCDVLGVFAAAGFFDGSFADVGSENLGA